MLRKTDQTVPFHTIPTSIITDARQKLKEIHGDKPVHPDSIVTVFKSMIYPGSTISGVPQKVYSNYGITFRIPLRNRPYPAFASMQQMTAF